MTEQTEAPPTYVEFAEHVATIVLDRPDALNAISTRLAETLARDVDSIGRRSDVRAVVVRSSSARAFCVGADLRERSSMSVDDLVEQRPTMIAAYGALALLPMPTIAAVGGFALGGGFELALTCDLIVADDTAVFGFPEVAVGLIPGGGGPWQAATRLGAARTADLVFTGRRLGADEADDWGLVARSVATGETADAARDLAASIATNAPLAVRHAKASLTAGLHLDRRSANEIEDDWWRRTVTTDDRIEGIAAFADKRPPAWTGT